MKWRGEKYIHVVKSGNGWEIVGGGGKKFSHKIEKCPIL
jgi:hypothetical protein